MNAVACRVDLERALQYRNRSSVTEHLPAIWKKNRGRRQAPKIVIQRSAAHESANLRVPPLAAVVTYKVRIIHDISSMCRADRRKRV